MDASEGTVRSFARAVTSAGRGPVTVLAVAICAMLGAQLWLAGRNASRTAELRGALSESHALANALERRIGYGGLIHDFKNYVLRPGEDAYRTAALEDAREALRLASRLSDSASELGIAAGLSSTREMIASYATRLEQVRELSADGRDRGFVDERVRFDDSPALLEVASLLGAIDTSVDERLASLQRQGALASGVATAGTAALGLLCIGVTTRRQRRHVAAVNGLVDELSASNAGLERANVSLSQFAGIVSHDLKTPLRHIELAGAMMIDEADDAESVAECADIVRQSAVRMDAIIASLLDFTKTGFALPRTEPLDVAGLLGRTAAELVPGGRAGGEPTGEGARAGAGGRADDARIELDVRTGAGSAVLADPELLSRVFSNLVDNAVKYARDDVPARIVLRADEASGVVTFSVADNGIGIDARFAGKVFEPMERLHAAGGRYEGVGIGLSLAKSIVESHGGRIRLDTGYTGGTRIAFTLPRADAPALPVTMRKAA